MAVRILHVVGDSKFGGASTGILRLAQCWRSLGWNVEVLATDPEFLRAAAERGVTVIPIDVIWRRIRILHDLWGLFRLVWFLRSREYTIVHTHTTKAGFVGRIAAWLAGVPVIIHTAHGFAFHESSPWWRIQFFTFMDRLASLCCDRVITCSHFHAQWGRELGVAAEDRIEAVPNGIPEAASVSPDRRDEIRRSLGIGAGMTMLLTHGRLAPEKGLEDLLVAYQMMRKSLGVPVKLVLAGDGPLRRDLECDAAARGLGDSVVFLGFRKDVPELLSATDIVVLPTWREGLSIALLEAMAARCSIITTSIGPNQEPTKRGRGALLTPPKDPARLAEAMLRFVLFPEVRERYRIEARRIYESEYSVSRMLSGYQRVYSCLIRQKQLPHSLPAEVLGK